MGHMRGSRGAPFHLSRMRGEALIDPAPLEHRMRSASKEQAPDRALCLVPGWWCSNSH